MRDYYEVAFRDVITLCIAHARTRTFTKSDPFLSSALQQPQIEMDINSTFANTEVWELTGVLSA